MVKIMFFASVFVALLGVSLCQDYKEDYMDFDGDMDFQNDFGLWKPIDIVKEKKGCCLPQEFELFEGMMLATAGPGRGRVGKPKIIMGKIQLAASSKKNKTVSDVYLSGPGFRKHVTVYQNLNTLTQYNFDPTKKTCRKSRIPAYKPFCVPDGAEVLGNAYFGNSEGANHINTTWYHVADKKNSGFVALTSTGNKNECFPVSEAVYGFTKGVSYAFTIDFMNFKPEVKYPSVFDIPSQCLKADVPIGSVQNPFGGSMFFS